MAERASSPVGENGFGQPAIDWNAALTEHRGWLRAVIWARTGEPQAVDEVLQEVALAAVESRSPLNDSSKVGAWLYKLAVRQALLYRRRHGRRRKLIGRYAQQCGPDQPEQQSADPAHWLLSAERQQLIREALGLLAPQDAEILLLKYTEDWSYWQLAEHLGISHSAVEARLHRARKRLREKLEQLNVVDVTS